MGMLSQTSNHSQISEKEHHCHMFYPQPQRNLRIADIKTSSENKYEESVPIVPATEVDRLGKNYQFKKVDQTFKIDRSFRTAKEAKG